MLGSDGCNVVSTIELSRGPVRKSSPCVALRPSGELGVLIST